MHDSPNNELKHSVNMKHHELPKFPSHLPEANKDFQDTLKNDNRQMERGKG